MSFRSSIGRIGLLVLISIVAAASASFGASWDSFKTATFSGIDLDKALQPNLLEYTLTIGDAPTVTIGSETYSVDWVQSFYVVSGTSGGSFVATSDIDPKNWTWDTKSSPAQISGWTGKGNNRLNPGESATFEFASFNPGENPVAPAYHISYRIGGDSVTDWFKAAAKLPNPVVPEPGSLLCLSVGVCGLFFVARQRKKARVL